LHRGCRNKWKNYKQQANELHGRKLVIWAVIIELQ
jgi:hypothetical protein